MRPDPSRWQLTHAHQRALVVGALGLVAGVVLHRVDLVVLALPFALVAAWALLTRPGAGPSFTGRLGIRTLREGQGTRWTVTATGGVGMEDLVLTLAPHLWGHRRPVHGTVVVPVPAGREGSEPVEAHIGWRSTRWGRHEVGPGLAGALGPWGAYRAGPHELPPRQLTSLPLPAVFDGSAPAPHPQGLVGTNRSLRRGTGSEFAGIRPFTGGDRLRHIHWPVSQRTGSLHVRQTYADQDTHVVLVADAAHDVGVGEGIDGRASSLDTTVRAAGAVAEHYLRRGERVSLRVTGAARVARIPPATGLRHLRRILGRLAEVRPGTARRHDEEGSRLDVGAGALVVMLSPLLAPATLQQAVGGVRRGLAVVVIDTLPDDAEPQDAEEATRLAWRLRMLERDREIHRVSEAGVPVIAWRGPGSLDQVLRDLGRQSRAARAVRR
ncbi:MAG TPA: DUF58 domain-containing protein [Segeticoccus sp.]|nr:DUF58 domain-containing protein [Segeticoccus sp.]